MYSRCTTKEFKTDISQLCENCPLLSEIPKAIEERIIFQAKEYYSIDPEAILDYIQSEITKAHSSMNQMQIESKKEGAYLNKISEIYIWNKERIKALNEFRKNLELEKESLPIGFPNKLSIDEAKELMNFAIKNELIKKDTKEVDFLYWFGCTPEERPNKLQPIQWMVNKQLARELLTGLYKDKILVAEVERITSICFIYKGSSLKLSKNKSKPDQRSDEIQNFLATL